ncbi:MAG: AAA family ATPase [Candidatus Eremiobacterota bacterium]
MDFEEQLETFLRARFTLISVITVEEERALAGIVRVLKRIGLSGFAWDAADGFERLTAAGEEPSAARDALTALERISGWKGDAVFVLKDFHDYWGVPQVKRKLRNLAIRLRSSRRSLIVLTPVSRAPEELKDVLVPFDLDLPRAAELDGLIATLGSISGASIKLTRLGREKLVQAALGLTASQAQRAFAKALVTDGCLDDRDITLVTEEKKLILRESEALEYYPVTETLGDVGGLGVLKEWLRLRERAFTREARDYGLPTPKGIALVGIPGTGKSLTAKMIGGLWNMPLLRLDVGSLFGSLLGESEEKARRALRLAETVAPCILWIDEIDKALSLGGGLDQGTSRRVLGSLVTWMQEKTAPCFVVATANDIGSLPPELLRRGRFDEMFFLDLPTTEERREILAVHLKRRNRLPQDFDLARLAADSQGYVGAELEQAVVDAMFVAFSEDREFTTEDVQQAIRRQVPLSLSQREVVEGLRRWLQEGRALSASFREASEAQQKCVPLHLVKG